LLITNIIILNTKKWKVIIIFSKSIFIIIGIISYILIILAFNYGFKKAQKVHTITLVQVKKEVPNGLLLRGLCSLIYYICIIDWMMFEFNFIKWSYFPFPIWVNWIGALLMILVVIFFWWIHITLGSNYNSPLHIYDNHQLITSGPLFINQTSYIFSISYFSY
jgi:protein-S-isoprenylcysteine O-methyltransferase Ste14